MVQAHQTFPLPSHYPTTASAAAVHPSCSQSFMRPPEAMQMLDSPACRLISLRKRRSRHQRCTYLGAECQVRLGKQSDRYTFMIMCTCIYACMPTYVCPPLSHMLKITFEWLAPISSSLSSSNVLAVFAGLLLAFDRSNPFRAFKCPSPTRYLS